MAVNRSEKKDNYTVISNHFIRNKNLSLKAKGLMTFILSLPDDWDYSLEGLAHENKEGVYSIRQAIKELEAEGYILRERTRRKGRLGGAEYTVNEIPCIKNPHTVKPDTDFPTSEKPMLEKPILDNPMFENQTYENHRQLNKDKQSKDIPSTDKSNTDEIKYGFNQR